jgi:hypothetical protein
MKTRKVSFPRSDASWGGLVGTLLLTLFVVGVALAAAIAVSVPMGWTRQPEHAVAAVLVGTIGGELVSRVANS